MDINVNLDVINFVVTKTNAFVTTKFDEWLKKEVIVAVPHAHQPKISVFTQNK
ncbi:hypothetical protein [Bacillus pseudomycoides]|uniref:hypothetical protein n=1 Tax=Bacillus pseudomycoides TaxID=64104 RepID=UPI0015966D6F|nr:hypothetical protein [Bacillus pseudomycoides]